MEDSLITAIVTEVISSSIVDAGKRSWKAIIQFVRARFAGDANAHETLELARREPSNVELMDEVKQYLLSFISYDEQFTQQLEDLIQRARVDISLDSSTTSNQMSGHVDGHLVQARDIHGDLNLN
jgi:hypothetical protein